MSDTKNPFSKPTPANSCPHCGSAAVTSVGHVLADITGTRREYRCQDCLRDFFRPVEPRPSALRRGGPATFSNTEAPTITFPWHSTRATDRPVYHDDTRCPEAGSIGLMHRRPNTGGRPHCAFCARSILGRLSSPAREGPETDARRCPACHSDRTARAEHVIVSNGVVVRREYQCAACEGAFWVREDGAQSSAPPDAV
jgi:DNA-directed RNA polymerase subunit RPC12/RpoP